MSNYEIDSSGLINAKMMNINGILKHTNNILLNSDFEAPESDWAWTETGTGSERSTEQVKFGNYSLKQIGSSSNYLLQTVNVKDVSELKLDAWVRPNTITANGGAVFLIESPDADYIYLLVSAKGTLLATGGANSRYYLNSELDLPGGNGEDSQEGTWIHINNEDIRQKFLDNADPVNPGNWKIYIYCEAIGDIAYFDNVELRSGPYKLEVNETLKQNGPKQFKRTEIGAEDYNPSDLTNDYHIAMTDTAAARAVIISTEDIQSATPEEPRDFLINDESGNAGTNNISVSLESGTLYGNGTINTNYGALTLYVDGTNGYVVGRS